MIKFKVIELNIDARRKDKEDIQFAKSIYDIKRKLGKPYLLTPFKKSLTNREYLMFNEWYKMNNRYIKKP